ncbi:MAG: double zinc ribbon domain-containing protein [Bacteroides fragilis]
MALIKCSECGNMVSDKAISCPKCGAPVVIPLKCEECGGVVPPSSVSCPHCGAPCNSSMIKCEECGQMIPCDSKSCSFLWCSD